MGRKQPPRKVSVMVNSRRPSSGQAIPISSSSYLQQAQELNGVEGSTSSFYPQFSQALHELQEHSDSDEAVIHQIREKLPLPPPDSPQPLEEGLKQEETDKADVGPPSRGAGRRWAYKNVFGLGISFLLVFTSFLGLQALQSSINSTGGLGQGSLAVLYVFFTISGFITPGIIKILGTKYSLLASFICHVVYILSNFYPSWYTLIPSSILLGTASALTWAAAGSHIVEVAKIVAPKLKQDQDHLISTFTGIFFFCFQCGNIPGSLASSLILYSGVNITQEDDLIDSNFSDTEKCDLSGANNSIEAKYLYSLYSVYIFFVSMGIFILMTMVSRLHMNKNVAAGKKFEVYFKAPLTELFAVMKSANMVLIAPISVFNGLEVSFIFGTFMEVYIANCFGAFQVGFTVIVFGVVSAIMSFMYGWIVKRIPRLFIYLTAGSINMALLIFLLMWTVVPSYLLGFLFVVLWGTADGAWNTMTASLTGILFPTRSDSAYSVQRIWLALGFTLGFASAEFLTVPGRIWLALGMALLALTCDVIVEVKTQHRNWCCYGKSYTVSNGDVTVSNDAATVSNGDVTGNNS